MWIETFSGRRFDLDDPKPEQVDLGDMAHSLSLTNRFTGHTDVGTSVAEHSIWVWKLIEREFPGETLLQLEAVLHDAHEYVTGDISAPMKDMLRLLAEQNSVGDLVGVIERRIQGVIHQHFALPAEVSVEHKVKIKNADIAMLATERRLRMPNTGKHAWYTDRIQPALDLTVDFRGCVLGIGNYQPPLIWETLFRETVEGLLGAA